MSGHGVQRLVRAYVRDTRVLVHTFRYPLLFFALLLLLGTLVLRLAYHPAVLLPWGEALHMALKLMFFETVAPYPVVPVAQVVFILWPVVGMVLAVDGILRFGTALFNRQGREEAWQVVDQELDLSIIFCRDARGVDYHPPGDRVLEGGDQIVVSASLSAQASLERMNLPEGEPVLRRRGRRTSRAGPPGQRRRR